MSNTIWAVVRDGKIIPLEAVKVPEGTRALVTLLPEDGTLPVSQRDNGTRMRILFSLIATSPRREDSYDSAVRISS
jgi:hypothetical protein